MKLPRSDRDQAIFIAKTIRKYIPSFEMNINGNYGEIRINNIKTFDTTGAHTIQCIMSYMAGLLTGLTYTKN